MQARQSISAELRKELSGAFLGERYGERVQELARPDCDVQEVKLYHNEAAHVVQLLQALATGPASLRVLDIYSLTGPAAGALTAFLHRSDTACRPTQLVLHSCEGTAAAAAVGAGLADGHCQVSDLSVAGLSDSELSAVLQPLAATLSHTPHKLQALSLLRCTIGPSTLSHAAVLAGLTRLQLTDCVISDDALGQLLHQAFIQPSSTQAGAHVAHACRLTELALPGSQAGPAAAKAISTLLAHPVCSLHSLDLHNCARLGDAGVQELARGLAHNHTLRTLNLSQCRVHSAGAEALAHALATQGLIESLTLNENDIGAAGLTALLLAVSSPVTQCDGHNDHPMDTSEGSPTHTHIHTHTGAATDSGLQQLSIEDNWVKGSELAAWPEGMRVCAPLRELRLARNTLGDAGTAYLRAALCGCGTLVQLDLCNNGVGPIGAQHLAQLLQEHPGLQELRLDQNRLHDAGALTLVNAASVHPSLHLFHADSCRVTDPTLRARVADTTQLIAGRRWQQQNRRTSTDSNDSQQGKPPRRVGKRFPADAYTMAAAVAARSAEPSPPPLAPPPGRVRVGSRFPAHVYAPQIAEEDSETEGTAENGQTTETPNGQAMTGATGVRKHVLCAEERETDPRALKVVSGTSPAAGHGGGSSGGATGCAGMNSGGVVQHGMSPFRDWQPCTPEVHGRSDKQEVSIFSGGFDASFPREYPERYSIDLPACNSGNISVDTSHSTDLMSWSPPTHARRAPVHAKSLDLGNRAPAQVALPPLPAAHSCGAQSAMPSRGSGSSSQEGLSRSAQTSSVMYLVARPSLRKRSLTPAQQAMFDMF